MENNIQTYIQFFLDEVELNISVTDKLKKLLKRAEKLNIL